MQDIRANLQRVLERVARAAERAGRRADDVLLIAVSKTVEAERIAQALAAGVRALGENRVQEARAKIAELGRPAPGHLVGQLQTNKAKEAVDLFGVIHSLDRRALRKLGERHGLVELSMGMSGDFEVAIEEGATMVRVGTAVFGPRPPRPGKEPGQR